MGFGGSCFKKDILALIYLAECKGLHEVASYWNAVIEMNNYRKKKFFQRVFHELNSNLKGKKLAILGTAFKKNTCDARESPAVNICYDLLIEGAILNIYDPKTTKQSVQIFLFSSLTRWNMFNFGEMLSMKKSLNTNQLRKQLTIPMPFWFWQNGMSSKLCLMLSIILKCTNLPIFSMEEASLLKRMSPDLDSTMLELERDLLLLKNDFYLCLFWDSFEKCNSWTISFKKWYPIRLSPLKQ